MEYGEPCPPDEVEMFSELGGREPFNCKGYRAEVGYSAIQFNGQKVHQFIGTVEGVPSIPVFLATTVDGIESAFRRTVNRYLKECEENGIEPARHDGLTAETRGYLLDEENCQRYEKLYDKLHASKWVSMISS
jgi:hypothetical protein